MKRWMVVWMVGLLLLIGGCGDLEKPEKVAVEFWEASYFRHDEQKLRSLISQDSDIDPNLYSQFAPIKPGKVWITSRQSGSAQDVFMFVSPELKEDSLLKEIRVIQKNGEWKVEEEKGHDVGHQTFEEFQKTSQYQTKFGGDRVWKEVDMD